MRVLAILINSDGKTIGARLINNGKILDVSTSKLLSLGIKFDNAIINSNGHVRSKHGHFPKIVIKAKPNAVEQQELIKLLIITL